jgi:hypothetical protein
VRGIYDDGTTQRKRRLTVRLDQELARLGDSIADYEAEFGGITAEEIARQRRADRQHAVIVRGTHQRGAKLRTS